MKYLLTQITAGDSVLLTHDATQQKMYPKQMFVHSDYSSATLAHDIALIRLGSPIVFNNNVSNVNLSSELPPYNTTLSVAGNTTLSVAGNSHPFCSR